MQQPAQQLRGHAERHRRRRRRRRRRRGRRRVVPAGRGRLVRAVVSRVRQDGVLRRERRAQPAQVPRDAQHRGPVRRAAEHRAQVSAVRARAGRGRDGAVRTVRGAVLRRVPRTLSPGPRPVGQAQPDGAVDRPGGAAREGPQRGRRRRPGRRVRRARGRVPVHVLHGVQDARVRRVRARVQALQPRRAGHQHHVQGPEGESARTCCFWFWFHRPAGSFARGGYGRAWGLILIRP